MGPGQGGQRLVPAPPEHQRPAAIVPDFGLVGTALERRTMTGARWWSPAEIRAAEVDVYPEGLADLVERCVQEVPGPFPADEG